MKEDIDNLKVLAMEGVPTYGGFSVFGQTLMCRNRTVLVPLEQQLLATRDL
jgi:hypothetical protein